MHLGHVFHWTPGPAGLCSLKPAYFSLRVRRWVSCVGRVGPSSSTTKDKAPGQGHLTSQPAAECCFQPARNAGGSHTETLRRGHQNGPLEWHVHAQAAEPPLGHTGGRVPAGVGSAMLSPWLYNCLVVASDLAREFVKHHRSSCFEAVLRMRHHAFRKVLSTIRVQIDAETTPKFTNRAQMFMHNSRSASGIASS